MKRIAVATSVLVVACAAGAPRRAVPEPTLPAPSTNPWSNPTRDLLALHCGRCHLGNLSTAPPRALAVFDLLEEPWYGRLEGEQFDGILTRLRATGALDPEDEAAVVRFVECARDGRCGPEEGRGEE